MSSLLAIDSAAACAGQPIGLEEKQRIAYAEDSSSHTATQATTAVSGRLPPSEVKSGAFCSHNGLRRILLSSLLLLLLLSLFLLLLLLLLLSLSFFAAKKDNGNNKSNKSRL